MPEGGGNPRAFLLSICWFAPRKNFLSFVRPLTRLQPMPPGALALTG